MKKLRTIRADSMSAALAEVKRELGADAVILHTRTVREGSVLGLGGKSRVEITAAAGAKSLSAKNRGDRVSADRVNGPNRGVPAGRKTESATSRKASRMTPADTPASTENHVVGAQVLSEVADLKRLVRGLVEETRRSNGPAVPEELEATYRALLEQEVAEQLARELVERVRAELSVSDLADPVKVRKALAACIESMAPPAGQITVSREAKPAVIAFVGPTGVGKTTTVAKLAADFALRKRLAVGLVTIDTYRIAAVDQLRTYAEIIGVPLEVVMSPEEMRPALERLSNCDVVLIDTAGRSQADEIRIQELKYFLAEAQPHEVHLVLSLTTGVKVIERATASFGALGADRVIFTKLDEAAAVGMMLNCLHRAGLRLSYVTRGQDVPDDIEVGAARRIAEWLCGAPVQAEARRG